jgi:large subunit ribosomal protein L25
MQHLAAQKRDILGKQVADLRSKGFLPAVVYGESMEESLPVSVDMKEFLRVWKAAGESTMVTLKIDGGKEKGVLIQDVAIDPVHSKPLHADFYEVASDKELKAHIPLAFEGESDAVKVLGGILVKVMHEIEIEALPKNLPHEITVDLTKLKTFDDHILLGDLKLPTGVRILGSVEALVAKVDSPRTEEELAGLSEKQDLNLEAIEAEKKGKKEQEEMPEGEGSKPSEEK